jgi:serine/threonine-protein kinase
MTRDPLPLDSRYECLIKIASGGMASVYVGRLRGAVGFWRIVAIKRAHAHLIEDPAFRRLLVAEARLASKIHHPNVVAVQDVEELSEELLLVMDYVEGAPLSELNAVAARTGRTLPPGVVVRIGIDACTGLHAAHELVDEAGTPLHLVHRDVSPQNLLVGLDGVTRIADFGIAKCGQSGTSATTTGALKGKVAYMSPEYIEGRELDARSDIFALGVVLWEALTGKRLFRGPNEVDTLRRVVEQPASKVSSFVRDLAVFDAVIAKAVEKSPSRRFATAREFGDALEEAARGPRLLASYAAVGAEVRTLVGTELEERRLRVRDHVSPSGSSPPRRGVDALDEDPAIHVTFTDLTGPSLQHSAMMAEASTLGSSVSSRRITMPLITRAKRVRRLRILAATGLGVVAISGLLLGRFASSGSREAEEAAAPSAVSAAGTPSAIAPSSTAGAPAEAARSIDVREESTRTAIPPESPTGAGSTPQPVASPGKTSRPISRPSPSPVATTRAPARRNGAAATVSDPLAAPPAPNPYER